MGRGKQDSKFVSKHNTFAQICHLLIQHANYTSPTRYKLRKSRRPAYASRRWGPGAFGRARLIGFLVHKRLGTEIDTDNGPAFIVPNSWIQLSVDYIPDGTGFVARLQRQKMFFSGKIVKENHTRAQRCLPTTEPLSVKK